MRRRFLFVILLVSLLGGLSTPRAIATAQVSAVGTAVGRATQRWFNATQETSAVESRAAAGKTETGRPGFWGWVGNIILQVAYWLLALFMGLVGIILDLAARFLDVILGVTHYARVEFVQTGWKFVRDVLNFVFIFILLAIAFSMIAGLEMFQARRLLPKLLLSALLVNFSLAIGGGINGIATCVMNAAVATLRENRAVAGAPSQLPSYLQQSQSQPRRGAGGGGVCGSSGRLGTELVTAMANSGSIARYYSFGPSSLAALAGFDINTFGTASEDPINVTGQSFDANVGALLGALSGSFFILLFLAAIIALTIIFFVRTVILLILLTLSPIPYALGLVPGAEGYGRQWWDQFLKYVLYGPITIVLLVLVIRILGTSTGTDPTQALLGELGTSTQAFTGLSAGGAKTQALIAAAFWTTFISLYIIAAILTGQRLGMLGAGMATSFGRRAALYTARGGPIGGAMWTRTGAPLVAGWKKAREETTKARTRGFFGRLGAREGMSFAPQRAKLAMERRLEEEEVKDLSARSATLAELNLARRAPARYALDKELVRDPADFERALSAVPLNSLEFNKGAKKYQERFPVRGTNFVVRMRENRAAEPKDYTEVLRGLSNTDAYEAFQRETALQDLIGRDVIKATENLARGIINAGDKSSAMKIALDPAGRLKATKPVENRLRMAGLL